jgi:uncharacterized membrane protein
MRRAEHWAARVLTLGGLAGVSLMVAGVILSSIVNHPAPTSRIITVRQIVGALSHRPIDPAGLSALGIVTLCVTPIVAVACAGAAFCVDRDRRFAVVSGIVVGVLFLSLWLGRA